MRSNVLGDHEETARSYHQLGALEFLQKASDMRVKLLGDHGDTTSSLNELRAVWSKLL